ncbi:MAG: site-2 protease family protein [Candidatus Bathyarchaeia archaeon]
MNEYINMLLSFTAFWAIIYIASKVLKTDRRGLKVGPFYLVYRTVKFNEALAMASKWKRFWKTVWSLGAFAGMGLLIFVAYSLIRNLSLLSTRSLQAAQLTVLVPGVTVSWPSLPYMLTSIFILIISHEAAHGIASLVEDVPIKSSGMFLAAVLPGGFVEIDEEKLEKAGEVQKLRIFAAGSFSNVVLGGVALLLVVNFPVALAPFYHTVPGGVLITDIVKYGAAETAGIKRWEVIYAIDQTRISNVSALRGYMKQVPPNSRITVTTNYGDYVLYTKPDPGNSSKSLIGVVPFDYYQPALNILPASGAYHGFMTAYWSNIVLVSVALINMLPIYPLDGGRYLDSLLKLLKVEKRNYIRSAASILFASVLTLNLILSLLNFGLRKL